MRKKLPLLLALLFLNHCHSTPSGPPPPSPVQQSLQLKPGMRLTLERSSMEGIPEKIQLRILELDPKEGLTLQWTQNSGTPNSLSFPNFSQAQSMTLPLYWPSGELFLSDSSGIWVAPELFRMLRENGNLVWPLGFWDNPFLGRMEDAPGFRAILESALGLLNQPSLSQSSAEASPELRSLITRLQVTGVQKYTLNMDGVPREVDAVALENAFLQLIVLDQRDNPLILAYRIQPKEAEVLVLPLLLLKPYFDFRVLALDTTPRP